MINPPRHWLFFFSIYELFMSTFAFFVPALVLMVVYTRILIVLIKRNKNNHILTDDKDVSDGFTKFVKSQMSNGGQGKEKQKTKMKKTNTTDIQTRRATLMCFVCLATFVCLWIFFHGGNLIFNIFLLIEIDIKYPSK